MVTGNKGRFSTQLSRALLPGNNPHKLDVLRYATRMHRMIKSALLAVGLVTAVATTAAAQAYYPYYYPGYGYPPYGYSPYSYSPGYAWGYGWPNYYYSPAPAYRAAPAYSDPYAWWRPYSDNAGPKASTRGGF